MKRPSSIEKETWACMTKEERKFVVQHEEFHARVRNTPTKKPRIFSLYDNAPARLRKRLLATTKGGKK